MKIFGAASMLVLSIALCCCGRGGPEVRPQADDSRRAAAATPGGADGERKRPRLMLRLVLRLEDGGVELLESVEAPNTIGRRDPLRRSRTFWRALAADGTVLAERGFRLERELRSETAGPDGGIVAARFEVEHPVFSLMVPLFPRLDRILLLEAAAEGSRDEAEPIGEVGL
ncbi:MAG: hypothetical protein R6V85_11930 [Polyangia bacterium]